MSGKSKEEVAFELVAKLKGVGVWGENNMVAILDMYAECLEATSGKRAVAVKTPPVVKRQSEAAALAAATMAEPVSSPPVRQAAPAPQAPLQQPMMHQPQVR